MPHKASRNNPARGGRNKRRVSVGRPGINRLHTRGRKSGPCNDVTYAVYNNTCTRSIAGNCPQDSTVLTMNDFHLNKGRTMYTNLKHIMSMFVLVVLVTSNSVFAQGTANGPNTLHTVDPGPIVVIGNPTNPMPIDLDPVGQPWTKTITDPNFLILNGGPLNLNESIINVGSEPWYDWHEHILPDATGAYPGDWSFVQMSVNGNPITFNALGIGTPNLWLDTFSQPVLPGDILNIRKIIDVVPGIPGIVQQPIVIQEYPTPEPASAALIGIGSLVLMARRKT